VLLTAGGAEAFTLLARTLAARHAVVVHPQFTEPEAALSRAGHRVTRVVLAPPFELDPDEVPDEADLVLVGNPTNPTSVLHPASALRRLVRPGRLVVVDEAFADCVPGEPDSLAGTPIPGILVVRSLTKTWALAGLRCGYALGDPDLIRTLGAAQPPWPVSAPALAACVACSAPEAVTEAARWAAAMSTDREFLLRELAAVPGVEVIPDPAASFVLLRHGGGDPVRVALREEGFAARRGDTFPGLGPGWLRVAVRDPGTAAAFTHALAATLARVASVSESESPQGERGATRAGRSEPARTGRSEPARTGLSEERA
jgi:histidinol-phosphate aminotransferase